MFFGSWDDVFRMTMIGAPAYCGTVIAAVAFAGDGRPSVCHLRMPDASESLNDVATVTTGTTSHSLVTPAVFPACVETGAGNEK